MTVRTLSELQIQSVANQVGSLIVVTPVCALLTGETAGGTWLLVAISCEFSDTIVTFPLILILTGLPWQQALLADVTLTLLGVVYSYVFHWGYDRLRPVQPVLLAI
jgi:uncharacterized membrane protein